MSDLSKKTVVEALGTFWLVLCGVGTAVLSAKFPQTGVGILGVSFAFGLSLLTMAYAIGGISGCHINPAVTVGLWAAGKFPGKDVLPYVVAQVAGAIAAAAIVFLIANGQPGFSVHAGFGTNGFGAHSPGGYSFISGLIAEVVFTAMFVAVIIGSTSKIAPARLAPLAIGLALFLANLAVIPVTNASINPARSTGPAVIAGGAALGQLWLFWLAPLVGGLIAGGVYSLVRSKARAEKRVVAGPREPRHV
ncbi:aquaporin Z [Vulgatibacter incomptus]|uniref:Aquaporin Z n=1 Tax=Vulgatibacter incomptus TaxID=1391653 RepID=A0A0K1PDH6_9BACT|nr:aquaporin Z [Vulgatibacter incomptus]AKU91169.1 Aquaporin Z [Vulgatibacter incomptus]